MFRTLYQCDVDECRTRHSMWAIVLPRKWFIEKRDQKSRKIVSSVNLAYWGIGTQSWTVAGGLHSTMIGGQGSTGALGINTTGHSQPFLRVSVQMPDMNRHDSGTIATTRHAASCNTRQGRGDVKFRTQRLHSPDKYFVPVMPG